MNAQPRFHYKSFLAHSRPVGSRNGFSTVPGYIPRGKKAVGIKQPDGTYLYVTPGAHPEFARGAVGSAQAKQQQFQNSNTAKNLPTLTALQRQKGQSYVNAREQQQRQGSAINAQAGRLATQRVQGQSYVNAREQQQRRGSAINAKAGRDAQARAYANSIQGRLQSAGQNIGNWLNTARNNIRNNNIVKSVKGAAKNIYNRVGEAWDGKAGAGTGVDAANNARSNASTYKMYAKRNPKDLKWHKAYQNQLNEAKRREEMYNNSIVGRFNNATNGVRTAVGGLFNKASDNVNRVTQQHNNAVSKAGGREAAQAKGDKINAAMGQKVKAQRQAEKDKAQREFDIAAAKLKMYKRELDKHWWVFDPDREKAKQSYERFLSETYMPAKAKLDEYAPKPYKRSTTIKLKTR